MGDAENNFQSSRKRSAGVQLSRDNPGLDDDEEEALGGTFKKASEDVLATRRIVKVRRQQTSTPAAPPPSAASNPFAAIRLVPPTSSAPSEVEPHSGQSRETEQAHSGQSRETEQTEESRSENKVGEPSKDESTTKEEKTDVNDDDTKQSENKIDDPEAQPEDEIDNVVNQEDKEKSVVEDVAEGGDSGDGTTKSTEADTSETQTGNDVKDDGDEKEKENEATAEKNSETVPFSSFRQLSSSQNAFSGLTGTGFSSTSFSFGSLTKDGTGLKSDSSSFSFGVSSNGSSSIFGSSVASTTIVKSESSKFPPMQEVPIETGEENENAVFTADSVLFEYIDGSWKERGKGELKVNVSTAGTGKARLVMRARGNYRLILNASIFPDMKLTNMDKKGITFACVNSASEGKDGLSTFALKFKDPSIVEDFRAEVTKHKSTAAPVALRTPENSPKADE
ncbi:hypothetical protein C2S53_018414 [Perilla frutescens var. hirtella]|uniref:RanBD1 domain-containing protein n=1 Tax=Perilla frutescens var. hirtella TaxID=608512 RepID=A0AAD4NZI2_PERFH|nr:hypothetical protein C2S53_018414 [Perilla frutescens var. hirtella]